VKKHGIPDLAPTIKFGKLNASAAESISQLPKNEQLSIHALENAFPFKEVEHCRAQADACRGPETCQVRRDKTVWQVSIAHSILPLRLRAESAECEARQS
jgi:hypothetical protein